MPTKHLSSAGLKKVGLMRLVGRRGMTDVQSGSRAGMGGMGMGMFAPRKERKEGDVSSLATWLRSKDEGRKIKG